MDSSTFDEIRATLTTAGPTVAAAQLCDRLRAERDYHSLFYGLLMKRRLELGVACIPTGPSQELPEAVLPAYETAIRETAREIGGLYLANGDIAQAWPFFRMIEEPQPVREALEKLQPGEDEDIQPLIGIAFYEGVSPRKGFDWVLQRYGICSAITTAGSGDSPHPDEVKQYCVRSLIRALYNELRHRLVADITNRFNVPPNGADDPLDQPGVVDKLMTGRDYLFDDEAYHIDTSHLSSVVQMSMTLSACPELKLAQELCRYGARLQGRFAGQDDPPFDEGYRDYEIYLQILDGQVEPGLSHFRKKVESCDLEETGTYPAEVLVNLLLKIGRGKEAVATSLKYLTRVEGRQLTCPNLNELCQRFHEYEALAQAAREQGDAVHYLAGLIAASAK